MKSLYFKKTWLALGFGMIITTLALMLMPNIPSAKSLPYLDKVEHFAVFLLLMMWFVQLFHRRFHVWIALALTGFGIMVEFLQRAGGHRSFELADIAADTTGVLAGWVLGATSLAGMLMYIENNYLKRVSPL